jgi:hemolysin III
VLHRWAFFVWWPVCGVLVAVSSDARERFATIGFSVGILSMFGVSALVHSRVWPVERLHRLFQLDHTAIFLCLVGTVLPIGLLAMKGAPATVLLAGMGVGCTLGIAAEWLPFHPPKFLMNAIYLTLGWFPVVLLPWMVDGLGALGLALLGAGGAAYTVGAIIVGAQRPDPAPEVFGYHEIWHALVVVAAAAHTAMVASLL